MTVVWNGSRQHPNGPYLFADPDAIVAHPPAPVRPTRPHDPASEKLAYGSISDRIISTRRTLGSTWVTATTLALRLGITVPQTHTALTRLVRLGQMRRRVVWGVRRGTEYQWVTNTSVDSSNLND